MRVSIKDLPKKHQEAARKALGEGKPGKRPGKYKNIKTVVEGEAFDSRLEAKVWLRLCEQYGRDNVIRQVSFPLGTIGRIRVDFMVIIGPAGGKHVFFLADAKGYLTREWGRKLRVLKERHGLDVELIKK